MSTALEKVLIGESCGTLVVFFTTQEPQDVTNAIFLLGAFLCARLGATPEQAWEPFEDLGRGIVRPFRDATWVASTYDLHVKDCWAGLVKAISAGLYSPSTFDKNEYFYYDNPAHGGWSFCLPYTGPSYKGSRMLPVCIL